MAAIRYPLAVWQLLITSVVDNEFLSSLTTLPNVKHLPWQEFVNLGKTRNSVFLQYVPPIKKNIGKTCLEG